MKDIALEKSPEKKSSWIQVTPAALEALRDSMRKENKPDAKLRVGVKGGGCSGLSYVFELDENPVASDDVVALIEGLSIVTDAKSFTRLIGLTLDYSGGLNGHGFEFKNPNAKATCGCGSSFSV